MWLIFLVVFLLFLLFYPVTIEVDFDDNKLYLYWLPGVFLGIKRKVKLKMPKKVRLDMSFNLSLDKIRSLMSVFKIFLPYLHWSKLHVRLKVGGADAAQTALLCGAVSASLNSLVAVVLNSSASYQKRQIDIEPSWSEKKLKLQVNCIVGLKTGHIISNLVKILIKRRNQNGSRRRNQKSYANSYE
ncbi:MAG: DUF2953 domain-containing protein [Bacillota bacterium]|jgi:hypothetical protein